MQIEIAIPILNEESTLDAQIRLVDRFLIESLTAYPETSVIIADNGSTDQSSEIGQALAKELDRVSYERVGQRGVGRALKHTWTRSMADVVGYMDLDLSTDLSHLPEALRMIEQGSDVVTGSRLSPGSKVIGRSPVRSVVSHAFNLIVRTYFGTHFADGMCGFKFLLREHVAPLIDLGAKSDGWFFATEILICAEYAGLRVDDLPVIWRDDPETKARMGKLTIEYLTAMRRLKRQLQS